MPNPGVLGSASSETETVTESVWFCEHLSVGQDSDIQAIRLGVVGS